MFFNNILLKSGSKIYLADIKILDYQIEEFNTSIMYKFPVWSNYRLLTKETFEDIKKNVNLELIIEFDLLKKFEDYLARINKS